MVSAEGRVRRMSKCKNCTNLYNLSDENDVIVGKWCPKINNSPDVETERECVHYNRMTNADRIRAMSDEELAELFTKLAWNSEVQTTPLKYLEWLQSEAK